MKRNARMRALMRQPGIIVKAGAYDALSALVVEQSGLPVIGAGGATCSNAILGLPDVGLVTMTEMAEQIRRMAAVTTIPIIADGDTGYGNAINVMRTVREFERAGASGVILEDQVSPKRCGHFTGKQVISKEEMVHKLEAALEARDDPDFMIIARTDARAALGFDEAIDRGRAYARTGADMVFVESPYTIEELRLVPKLIDAPTFANMISGGGFSPLKSCRDLEEMGFKMANFGAGALQAVMKTLREFYQELKTTGTTAGFLDRMLSFDDRQALVGLPQVKELERRFGTAAADS